MLNLTLTLTFHSLTLNQLSRDSVYLFPKFNENTPTAFRVMLLTNKQDRQRNGSCNTTPPTCGRGTASLQQRHCQPAAEAVAVATLHCQPAAEALPTCGRGSHSCNTTLPTCGRGSHNSHRLTNSDNIWSVFHQQMLVPYNGQQST